MKRLLPVAALSILTLAGCANKERFETCVQYSIKNKSWPIWAPCKGPNSKEDSRDVFQIGIVYTDKHVVLYAIVVQRQ